MALTAGIVGLPNVGKSTLFNAITNSTIEAANYPFATIEPNVGVVEVPDKRLDKITELIKPKKTIPTLFEFTDIAGIVRGASKGEGLGNKFLSHIREVDAICHVVRCFEDSDIVHVDGGVDPQRDIETINLELILADLETISTRRKKIERKAQSGDKDSKIEHTRLEKIENHLMSEQPIRTLELNEEEHKLCLGFHLLTIKPMLYVCNVAEDELLNADDNKFVKVVKELAAKEKAQVVTISAKIESEIAQLDEDSKKEFMAELGIEEPGLNVLINAAYRLIGLATYFTAGEKEVRAWTFKDGMTAPECAGVIHTDFQRGFIKADIYAYKDLEELGSEEKVKQEGKLRLEGKEYIMKDGDVCHFKFNV